MIIPQKQLTCKTLPHYFQHLPHSHRVAVRFQAAFLARSGNLLSPFVIPQVLFHFAYQIVGIIKRYDFSADFEKFAQPARLFVARMRFH